MSKVYCKSDFDKLEKEFKTQRLRQQEQPAADQDVRETLDNETGKKTSWWQRIKKLFGG